MASSKQIDMKTAKPAMVQVLNGIKVPQSLYTLVEGHLSKKLPGLKLEPSKLYTLRELYGEHAWQAIGNNWARRQAGRCFAHMVAYGKFSFVFVQYKRSCTKHYRPR